MSAVLTREVLKRACEQVVQRMKSPEKYSAPAIYCHPLEFPFYDALFGPRVILDSRKNSTVLRWLFECFRKYRMGEKTRDQRWTMAALIEQYTRKIEALR